MRALTLALLLVGAAMLMPPIVELPAPTGPSPVGTTTWHLTDSTRPETFDRAAGAREVEVQAWYPAATTGGTPAPYLRDGLESVRSFATVIRSAAGVFDDLAGVTTHAALDAPPAATPSTFPVLVFSHGYTGVPGAYTALLEDLASHGYVVLSVIHPFEASAARRADGRVVSMLDASGTIRGDIRGVLDEWQAEDATMAAVTSTTDEAEQLRLMRAYLSGLHLTQLALTRWVDDTRLVIDRLPSIARTSAAGRIASRIDLARLGAFGHSMGGVTAAQFCLDDKRCRAALNLDGIPQYGPMIDRTFGRPLLMVYSARPGREGASDVIYRRAASPYVRVDIAGTRHLDFSDMTFWDELRRRAIIGPLAASRVTSITRAIVREFFDQTLLGRRSAILAGDAVFPEVTVTTFRPAR